MKIKRSELKEMIREILEEKNWIKGAIKKPGALRKQMGATGANNRSSGCLPGPFFAKIVLAKNRLFRNKNVINAFF